MTTDTPYEVSWDARNPQNLNYSRPTGFRLNILNLPQVNFFCQSVVLPNINLGIATQHTPLADIAWPGEKLTFGELSVKFIIQSDWANYIELYNWFIGLGDPSNNDEYQAWIDAHDWRFPGPGVKNSKTVAQQFSDGVLTILSANNVPTVQVHFYNLFPVALNGVEFDISEGRTEYLTTYATFKYQYFVPVPLSS